MIPKRNVRERGGKKPGVGYLETNYRLKKDENGDSVKEPKWKKLTRIPTKSEEKVILALVLTSAMKTSVNNHTYVFNQQIR